MNYDIRWLLSIVCILWLLIAIQAMQLSKSQADLDAIFAIFMWFIMICLLIGVLS